MMLLKFIFPFFATALLCNLAVAQSTRESSNTVTFDGRTPCQELAVQFNEPVTDECIKIKWRLLLKTDPLTGAPAGYNLQGFKYRNEKARTGDWQILHGWKDNKDANIIQLNTEGKAPLLLLQVDQNVLFFLDKDLNVMVGNRDFSYTLNKVAG